MFHHYYHFWHPFHNYCHFIKPADRKLFVAKINHLYLFHQFLGPLILFFTTFSRLRVKKSRSGLKWIKTLFQRNKEEMDQEKKIVFSAAMFSSSSKGQAVKFKIKIQGICPLRWAWVDPRPSLKNSTILLKLNVCTIF